jgi:hypothetical protein
MARYSSRDIEWRDAEIGELKTCIKTQDEVEWSLRQEIDRMQVGVNELLCERNDLRSEAEKAMKDLIRHSQKLARSSKTIARMQPIMRLEILEH